MGSHARYAPVPQRDQEVIILDTIHSPGYNFNTGIPNSVASSQAPSVAHSYHAPSIRSIPNSPPPSFHTHSSPGTPRATPSTTAAELWGVAPSSISLNDSSPTEICAASDALNTIRTLQARVERLEESLGRLILEKEDWQRGEIPLDRRHNCCLTFSDASPDLERDIAHAGHNCCVTFKGKKNPRNEERRKQVLGLLALLILATMIVGISAVTTTKGKGNGGGR